MVARTGREGCRPAGEGGAGEAGDGGGGGGHGDAAVLLSANKRSYVSLWSSAGLALISRWVRAALRDRQRRVVARKREGEIAVGSFLMWITCSG